LSKSIILGESIRSTTYDGNGNELIIITNGDELLTTNDGKLTNATKTNDCEK